MFTCLRDILKYIRNNFTRQYVIFVNFIAWKYFLFLFLKKRLD